MANIKTPHSPGQRWAKLLSAGWQREGHPASRPRVTPGTPARLQPPRPAALAPAQQTRGVRGLQHPAARKPLPQRAHTEQPHL